MTIGELCVGLCESLGIDDLRPDADGAFALSVDDITVEFLFDGETGRLLLDAAIGNPPSDGADFFCRRMLEANRLLGPTGGATLYLDPADGHAAACRSDLIAPLDIDAFLKLLEDFVNLLREWRALREEFSKIGGEVAAQGEKVAAEESAIENSGYLKV